VAPLSGRSTDPALTVLGQGAIGVCTRTHMVFVVGTHVFFTPFGHVLAAAHDWHGDLPEVLKVEPDTHGTGGVHAVSLDAVHAASTPCGAQDNSAVQVEHGERPSLLHVVPPAQAVLHTVFVVPVHAVCTPLEQLAELEHAPHGALPVAAFHVFPLSQSGASLQTRLNEARGEPKQGMELEMRDLYETPITTSRSTYTYLSTSCIVRT